MRASNLQRLHICPAGFRRLDEVGATPSEPRPAKLDGEGVRGQASVASGAIREGVDGYETVVEA